MTLRASIDVVPEKHYDIGVGQIRLELREQVIESR
jgi:hypothetical protein